VVEKHLLTGELLPAEAALHVEVRPYAPLIMNSVNQFYNVDVWLENVVVGDNRAAVKVSRKIIVSSSDVELDAIGRNSHYELWRLNYHADPSRRRSCQSSLVPG
jgi:hypothetical protein